MVYANENGHRVEVVKREDGRVHFHAEGGGFRRVRSEEEFDAEYKEAGAPKLLRGKVTGEWRQDLPPMDAWVSERRWNGWAAPFFEFEQARVAIGEALGGQARYDAQLDAFIAGEGDEEETYPAETLLCEDGKVRKLYGVGAGAWCWEAA